jgi:hypothetical protein
MTPHEYSGKTLLLFIEKGPIVYTASLVWLPCPLMMACTVPPEQVLNGFLGNFTEIFAL